MGDTGYVWMDRCMGKEQAADKGISGLKDLTNGCRTRIYEEIVLVNYLDIDILTLSEHRRQILIG